MKDKGGLALIFGPPKKGKAEESSDGYSSDIPPDFADHCDAAFDALKGGKREKFCEELWLAMKAYEETPHEEAEEDEEEDHELENEED
jgi:hypothetical protein